MMDRQARIAALLDEISGEADLLGAALVSRDGLGVRASGALEIDRETFSAMSATVMGAAEIALAELDGGRTSYLIASTEKLKLVILGATRDILLVAAVESSASLDKLLPRLETAAQRVATVVAGG